ncbi:MAG TPA: hypothetical protein VKP65_14235 [Rhodothermales bacterium]|nr:hypothetical protein [Rhodothermales bacterium]
MQYLSLFRLFMCALLLVASGASFGCSDNPTESDPATDLSFSFENSADGWTGSFADYPTSKSAAELELIFDRRALPDDVSDPGMGLLLTGMNQSDDLFMFLKREVTGLEPNTSYTLTYHVTLASNSPSGCAGIGGAPGESVFLKVGAARVEPEAIIESGDYRLNVDKSNQASDGENAIVIGNVANGVEQCTGDIPYRLITLDNEDKPFTITTDNTGTLWLLVGTESGFEGTTTLYYDRIEVNLDA